MPVGPTSQRSPQASLISSSRDEYTGVAWLRRLISLPITRRKNIWKSKCVSTRMASSLKVHKKINKVSALTKRVALPNLSSWIKTIAWNNSSADAIKSGLMATKAAHKFWSNRRWRAGRWIRNWEKFSICRSRALTWENCQESMTIRPLTEIDQFKRLNQVTCNRWTEGSTSSTKKLQYWSFSNRVQPPGPNSATRAWLRMVPCRIMDAQSHSLVRPCSRGSVTLRKEWKQGIPFSIAICSKECLLQLLKLCRRALDKTWRRVAREWCDIVQGRCKDHHFHRCPKFKTLAHLASSRPLSITQRKDWDHLTHSIRVLTCSRLWTDRIWVTTRCRRHIRKAVWCRCRPVNRTNC